MIKALSHLPISKLTFNPAHLLPILNKLKLLYRLQFLSPKIWCQITIILCPKDRGIWGDSWELELFGTSSTCAWYFNLVASRLLGDSHPRWLYGVASCVLSFGTVWSGTHSTHSRVWTLAHSRWLHLEKIWDLCGQVGKGPCVATGKGLLKWHPLPVTA